jgi:hypothetical protein
MSNIAQSLNNKQMSKSNVKFEEGATVQDGVKAEKKKREEKLNAIEKKAIKLNKAVATLEDLADGMSEKDSAKKAVNDCIQILNNQLNILENAAAAMVKAKFAELNKLYRQK